MMIQISYIHLSHPGQTQYCSILGSHRLENYFSMTIS